GGKGGEGTEEGEGTGEGAAERPNEHRRLRRRIASIVEPEVVESIARLDVSVSLDAADPLRFPSVLLQPLGHLSALESTSCKRSNLMISEIVIHLLIFPDHLP